jgi:hypothetical protein
MNVTMTPEVAASVVDQSWAWHYNDVDAVVCAVWLLL